jgi:hypothetical protein
VKSVTRAFDVKLLQRVGLALGGNIATVFGTGLATKALPVLGGKWVKIATTLGVASLISVLSAQFLGAERAGDVLLGGGLAAATDAAKGFGLLGLDEDYDGFEGWDDEGLGDFVRPYSVQRAFGVGDYATLPQAGGAVRLLDGMGQDDVVAQEIASQA